MKTFSKMGLRKCKDTFCFVSLVSYELRYNKQKCICALGVGKNSITEPTDANKLQSKMGRAAAINCRNQQRLV